jgi:ABC-type uncharacterized transport system ATPase subunit
VNLEKFEVKVQKMTDEEALQATSLLLRDKVKVGTVLLQDDMRLVVGTKTVLVAGKLLLEGDPVMLDWPLQPMPMPEAFKRDHPEEFN